jgi:hypothetical protein
VEYVTGSEAKIAEYSSSKNVEGWVYNEFPEVFKLVFTVAEEKRGTKLGFPQMRRCDDCRFYPRPIIIPMGMAKKTKMSWTIVRTEKA